MLPATLRDGYRAFVYGRMREEQDRFIRLATSGQNPKVMIVGCCDSRVPPEVIFNARPGELFVVRNVANLIPPYDPDGDYHGTAAAIEFGVTGLDVDHLVILGHARCGGIRAYAATRDALPEAPAKGDFIGKWISQLSGVSEDGAPEIRDGRDKYLNWLEIASLKKQLQNLRAYPWIAEREAQKKLKLHACYFDIATGILTTLIEPDGVLKPVMSVRSRLFPKAEGA